MCSTPKIQTPAQQIVTPMEAAKPIAIPQSDKAPAGLDMLRLAAFRTPKQ